MSLRYASGSSLSHRDPNRDRANLLGEGHVYGNASASTSYAGSASPYRSASTNPYGSGHAGDAAYASQRTAEDLESQNEDQLEGLSAKVKMLKDVRAHGRRDRAEDQQDHCWHRAGSQRLDQDAGRNGALPRLARTWLSRCRTTRLPRRRACSPAPFDVRERLPWLASLTLAQA